MDARPPHPSPRHEAVIALTIAMVPIIHDGPVNDEARSAIELAVDAIAADATDYAGRALLAALPPMLRLYRARADAPERQRWAHNVFFGVLRSPTPLTEHLPMDPIPPFPTRWDDKLGLQVGS